MHSFFRKNIIECIIGLGSRLRGVEGTSLANYPSSTVLILLCGSRVIMFPFLLSYSWYVQVHLKISIWDTRFDTRTTKIRNKIKWNTSTTTVGPTFKLFVIFASVLPAGKQSPREYPCQMRLQRVNRNSKLTECSHRSPTIVPTYLSSLLSLWALWCGGETGREELPNISVITSIAKLCAYVTHLCLWINPGHWGLTRCFSIQATCLTWMSLGSTWWKVRSDSCSVAHLYPQTHKCNKNKTKNVVIEAKESFLPQGWLVLSFSRDYTGYAS